MNYEIMKLRDPEKPINKFENGISMAFDKLYSSFITMAISVGE